MHQARHLNNIMYKAILSILTIGLLSHCTQQNRHEVDSTESYILPLSHNIVDSIPLFNDNFDYMLFDISKIESDSLFLTSYPNLDFHLVNSKGKILKKIAKKGGAPFELSDLFRISFTDDYLFVMEEGNVPILRIFDNALEHDTTINLYNYMDGLYIPSFTANFHARMKNEKYYLTFNIGSTNHDLHTVENMATPGIAELVINKDLEIENINYLFPSNSFGIVKESINKNKLSWEPECTFKFHIGTNRNILLPNFENAIYIYDSDWKSPEKLEFHKFDKSYFFMQFQRYSEIKDRKMKLFRLKYSNPNPVSMSVDDDMLYFVYPELVKDEDKAYMHSKDVRNHFPNVILCSVNLTNGKQYRGVLPPKVASYGKIKVADDTLYIGSNINMNEDGFIYKIKLDYEL